jgi:hypothetical protein
MGVTDRRKELRVSPLITGIPFNVLLPYVTLAADAPDASNTVPAAALLVTRFKDIPVTLIFAVKAESIQVIIFEEMDERVEFIVRKSVDDGKIEVLNVSVPTFEMLHRFMSRAPVIVVAANLVIVAELRFALLETTNELVVSIPLV